MNDRLCDFIDERESDEDRYIHEILNAFQQNAKFNELWFLAEGDEEDE